MCLPNTSKGFFFLFVLTYDWLPWSLTLIWTRSPSTTTRLGTRPWTNIGGRRYEESFVDFVSNTHNSVEHLVMPDSHLAMQVYTPVSADSKFDIESLAVTSSQSDDTRPSSVSTFSSSLRRTRDRVTHTHTSCRVFYSISLYTWVAYTLGKKTTNNP